MMNRRLPARPLRATTHRGRVACALAALSLVQLSWSADLRQPVTHTIIAATGTATPADGNILFFLNPPAINGRGQVAFDAFLNGPGHTGVFVSQRGKLSTIALGGDGFVSSPSLTDRGDVLFSTDTGIFRDDGTTTSPIVQNGDPAPEGGSQDFIGQYSANSQGVIAYHAFLSGEFGNEGIFRSNGRHTATIALDTTVPPTGGSFNLLGDPQIDERGEAAFFAGMQGGTADFAIFRGDGESLDTIFAAGQPAPGGGTFQDFGDPSINKHGQVLAQAALESAPDQGLYLGDSRNAVAIAVSGQLAPRGGIYCRAGVSGCPGVGLFLGRTELNDRGQAAFAAFLTGGESRLGVFRGDGRSTTTIALAGAPAAGTTGTFESFSEIRLGDDGRVGFIATLTQGVGGVDTTNNRGIWVGTSTKDLHLVVRSGELIAGQALTSPVSLSPLENRSPVVWVGRLSGTTTAIISSTAGDCEGGVSGQ